MDLYINGKQKITLTQRDFKAKGGEGAVYVRRGVAYKVYTDPAKMIPSAKVQELAALTEPALIKPEELLMESNGLLVGFTMQEVPDAVPLCLTFNKAFRDRHHLTPDRVLPLVEKLRDMVQHVHSQGILIVDLNEMNFLLSQDLTRVYGIDVDSYQTQNYPATALMETVRDRHNTTFSPGTDWFSFAVVSFQMFIGIHPYRGKHTTLGTIDARMMANVSALNPSVSLPSVCLPLTVIPQAYRDWYEAVLERGMRVPPPDGPVATFVLNTQTVAQILKSGAIDINRLAVFEGTILDAVGDAVLTDRAVYVQGRKWMDLPSHVLHHLVVGTSGTVLVAWREGEKLRLMDVRRQQEVPVQIQADSLESIDGRLYARQGDNLMELALVETPAKVFASGQIIGSVLPQATQLFPGVAFQDLLGAKYASLLPEKGKSHQVRLPELDSGRIVDAGFQGSVLIVVAEKRGQFDRFIFRFGRELKDYDLRTETDIETHTVNFVTLPTGICLHLTEGPDGEQLDVFSASPGNGQRKIIPDTALTGDCRLFRNGTQARIAKGDTLYEIQGR